MRSSNWAFYNKMMPGGQNITELFNFITRSHKPGAYIADKIKKNSRDLDIFFNKKKSKIPVNYSLVCSETKYFCLGQFGLFWVAHWLCSAIHLLLFLKIFSKINFSESLLYERERELQPYASSSCSSNTTALIAFSQKVRLNYLEPHDMSPKRMVLLIARVFNIQPFAIP